MKKLFLLITVVSIGFLSSCDDEPGNTNIDVDFNFTVKNSGGENLLDPKIEDHYIKDSIRLYLLKNGEKIDIYQPNLAAPRRFEYFQNSGGDYGMIIYPTLGDGDKSQTTTILIQWDKSDFNNIDTVQTYIDKTYSNGNTIIYNTKVIYNGTVVWSAENYPYYTQWGTYSYKRFFEIVK